jgi:hypothetical protein
MTDTPVIDCAHFILIDPPVANAIIVIVIIPMVSVNSVTILTGRTLDSAVMTTRAEMYH